MLKIEKYDAGAVQNHLTLDFTLRFPDEKAIIDQYATFNGKSIGKRGYVGQYSEIDSKVVGELAIIHEYVELKSDTAVKPNDIYIRTPSSLILYQKCDQDVSDDEYVLYFRILLDSY